MIVSLFGCILVACPEDVYNAPVRSAISIIPQESQMFEGTMRENVDPTGVHEDADIWTALEQAHLKDFVQGLPGALDAKVQEGGASLSSGQRQLLCFARALLRKVIYLVFCCCQHLCSRILLLLVQNSRAG